MSRKSLYICSVCFYIVGIIFFICSLFVTNKVLFMGFGAVAVSSGAVCSTNANKKEK